MRGQFKQQQQQQQPSCEVTGANQLPFLDLGPVLPSRRDGVDAIKQGRVRRLLVLFARDPAQGSWRVSSVDTGVGWIAPDANIQVIFYCSQ